MYIPGMKRRAALCPVAYVCVSAGRGVGVWVAGGGGGYICTDCIDFVKLKRERKRVVGGGGGGGGGGGSCSDGGGGWVGWGGGWGGLVGTYLNRSGKTEEKD